jgi:hypothetical protein
MADIVVRSKPFSWKTARAASMIARRRASVRTRKRRLSSGLY